MAAICAVQLTGPPRCTKSRRKFDLESCSVLQRVPVPLAGAGRGCVPFPVKVAMSDLVIALMSWPDTCTLVDGQIDPDQGQIQLIWDYQKQWDRAVVEAEGPQQSEGRQLKRAPRRSIRFAPALALSVGWWRRRAPSSGKLCHAGVLLALPGERGQTRQPTHSR